MGFKMINEWFICSNCWKEITKHPTWSARNHCPFCLHSMHLDDKIPWDRMSICEGIMTPVDIEHRKWKWYMIVHECKKCAKKSLNKLAPDDNYLPFMKTRSHKLMW